MRALTLWQPWASLIAVGAKTIETRSWSTTYRGPLAIHAAKRQPDWSAMKELVAGHAWNEWYAAGLVAEDGSTDHIPLGAVVAVCDLVDVVPIVECPPYRKDAARNWSGTIVCQGRPGTLWLAETGPVHPIHDQLPFGDFTPGRYAWLLDNVRPLTEPYSMKGAQGLRRVPDDMAREIERCAS